MKKIIFLTIIIVSFFVIQSLARSIYTLFSKHDLLVKAENELRQKKRENQELKNRLLIVEDEGFVEQEARNKLFLQKPGESRVIVDKRLIEAILGKKTAVKEEQKPSWQKWWELFF